ncbi:hypothetical protein MLD38_021456 [Melastoma candidum]|uniref:Uncharacterized protein n=1 Tax=Melastoma candidum TaxID=119954 RepID=A0ACB9QFJ6_9MYRT|nr:hypothetical protein MLD38_021456 [Melastoma candidum]
MHDDSMGQKGEDKDRERKGDKKKHHKPSKHKKLSASPVDLDYGLDEERVRKSRSHKLQLPWAKQKSKIRLRGRFSVCSLGSTEFLDATPQIYSASSVFPRHCTDVLPISHYYFRAQAVRFMDYLTASLKPIHLSILTSSLPVAVESGME